MPCNVHITDFITYFTDNCYSCESDATIGGIISCRYRSIFAQCIANHDQSIPFITAFWYCKGVHPSVFLNHTLKLCGCWKPISAAISLIRFVESDNFSLAISNIFPCISFSAEIPVAVRTRSLK